MTIQNANFMNNIASVEGGAIDDMGASPLKITDGQFMGNKGGEGGGVADSGDMVTITESDFETNTATDASGLPGGGPLASGVGGGGGIYQSGGALSLTNSILWETPRRTMAVAALTTVRRR